MSTAASSSSSSSNAPMATGKGRGKDIYNSNNKPPKDEVKKAKKEKKQFDWSKVETERCLMKIAYIGTNYYGIAYQLSM